MKRPLIFYFTSETFLSFGIGLAGYGQPFFYQAGGLSDGAIGTLVAVNAASSGLFALFLGPVADRVGASRVFKLATLLVGLAFLSTSLTHGFWPWFGTSIFQGLATGMLMSTENVVLSSLSASQEKAGILSKFVSLYMLLIGLGTVSGGWVSSVYSFQAAMLVAGILGVVASAIRVFVRAPDAKSHRMFRLPSGRIARMSLYAVLFGTAIGLFRPFVTLVLHGTFGLNNGMTSAVSAATLFMVSLGSFMVSPLLRRFRHDRTLSIGFVMGILFTALMAGLHSPFLFSGTLLMRTILTSVPGPIVDSMFLEWTPATDYSQMFGVRVFGNSAGNAIGSYAGGLFLNHGALSLLLLSSAGMLVVAGGYLFWLLRRIRKASASEVRSAEGEATSLQT